MYIKYILYSGISVCTDILYSGISVCTEYISVYYSERIMSIQFVMCYTYNYTSVIACSDRCKRAY